MGAQTTRASAVAKNAIQALGVGGPCSSRRCPGWDLVSNGRGGYLYGVGLEVMGVEAGINPGPQRYASLRPDALVRAHLSYHLPGNRGVGPKRLSRAAKRRACLPSMGIDPARASSV